MYELRLLIIHEWQKFQLLVNLFRDCLDYVYCILSENVPFIKEAWENSLKEIDPISKTQLTHEKILFTDSICKPYLGLCFRKINRDRIYLLLIWKIVNIHYILLDLIPN